MPDHEKLIEREPRNIPPQPNPSKRWEIRIVGLGKVILHPETESDSARFDLEDTDGTQLHGQYLSAAELTALRVAITECHEQSASECPEEAYEL